MPNATGPQLIALTIGTRTFSAVIDEWEVQLGSRPSVVTATLLNQHARSLNSDILRWKQATFSIDGTQVFTGYVYGISYGLSGIQGRPSDYVRVRLLDRRQLFNKTYIGARHLGANGLRVLGADIVFNLNGKPNKDKLTGIYLGTPVAPAFIYDKGNVADPEDCAVIEADYWTWGDILYWIWANYVDDIVNPIDLLDVLTIPNWGGLDKKAGELNILGAQVGGAIDHIFSRTNASMCLRGDGTIYLFSRTTPIATESVKIKPAGVEVAASSYDETYVVDIHVTSSIEDVVTDVDIIGGPEQREIMTANYTHVVDMDLSTPPGSPALNDKYRVKPTGAGDWAGQDNDIATWTAAGWYFEIPFTDMRVIEDDSGIGWQWNGTSWTNIGALADDYYAAEDYSPVDPNPAPAPITLAIPGLIIPYAWSNCQNELTKLHRFSHVRYSAHGAGKDIRRKDQAKPITGELLIHRDKSGNFVSIESECGINGVSDHEGLSTYYASGATPQYDIGAIATFRTDPPNRWTHVVQMETRQYVTASGGTPGVFPTSVRMAAFRPEFVHKTREATKIQVPVSIVWTVNGVNSTSVWTITPKTTTPAGATLDFATSFSGAIYDAGWIPTFDPTMSLTAGVVVDGIGPLNEVKSVVEDEIGFAAKNIQGTFPRWKNILVGSVIDFSGADWDFGDRIMIVALHFDGATQSLSFAATNHIGADALQLAQSFFVDRRRFRR